MNRAHRALQAAVLGGSLFGISLAFSAFAAAPAQARSHQTLAGVCNTSPAALMKALQAGGRSPIAICRTTNPAITRQSLVSVIMSSYQSRLAAMAGNRGRTAQQENRILSHIQVRINRWVTSPSPTYGTHPF